MPVCSVPVDLPSPSWGQLASAANAEPVAGASGVHPDPLLLQRLSRGHPHRGVRTEQPLQHALGLRGRRRPELAARRRRGCGLAVHRLLVGLCAMQAAGIVRWQSGANLRIVRWQRGANLHPSAGEAGGAVRLWLLEEGRNDLVELSNGEHLALVPRGFPGQKNVEGDPEAPHV